LDPDSFKAYYRRCEAYVAMGELDKADEDLIVCRRLQAASKDVAVMTAAITKRREEQRAKQKQFQLDMAARMQGRSTPTTATTSTSTT
jgi:hypothetical protein